MNPDVTFTEAFPSLVFTCAFKGTLFLLVTGLFALCTSSASRRHFVWVSSFVGLGLLVLLELFSSWRLEVLPAWTQATGVASAEAWLLLMWMIGVGLFALRAFIGLISLLFIERRSALMRRHPFVELLSECRSSIGVHRKVQLLQFPGRIMPMTWGVMRSFIVLPASAVAWSQDRVRAVLMHEMAHIHRGDFIATLVRDAVNVLYWFHPLVWWAAREMDEDREEASDDVVMAAGQPAIAYAEHLAAVATGTPSRGYRVSRPHIALANRPLVMRIRGILTPWKSRYSLTWLDRLQLGAVVSALALLVGMLAPQSSNGLKMLDETSDSVSSSTKALVAWKEAEMTPSPGVLESWRTPANERLMEEGWRMVEGLPVSVAMTKDSSGEFGKESREFQLSQDLAVRNGSMSSVRRGSTSSSLSGTLTPAAEYSANPPGEGAEDRLQVFEFEADHIIPNLGNVALNGVDEFTDNTDSSINARNYANIPPNLPDEIVAEFIAALRILEKQVEALFGLPKVDPAPPANSFVFDSGLFQIANALISDPQPLVASVEKPAKRLITEKLFVDEPSVDDTESKMLRDEGLVTEVTVVKSSITGEHHLGISFWRKPNFPTAKYWIEASPDLGNGSWVDEQEKFVLANYGLREDGRQVVVVVLTEPISESPYRYMRVRSNHEG